MGLTEIDQIRCITYFLRLAPQMRMTNMAIRSLSSEISIIIAKNTQPYVMNIKLE